MIRGAILMTASALILSAAASAQTTNAAMWIWSDKNVYQPGEPLTLRGTLKANGDTSAYTLVAFRQNNQTGQKFFLPRGTEEVTDIFGNTQTVGFRSVELPALNKTVLVGENGLVVNSTLSVPAEFGMHTLVLQLRDETGNRVIKSAYWKLGVVRERVRITSNITQSTLWTSDRAYELTGIVSINNNATLTIEPGTFVIGQPGSQPPSALLVTTAGRLIANGTRSRPIIMTSSRPIGQRARGDWGGLIMLGRAPINDPGGSLPIEGLPDAPETRFGGTDADHGCGLLKYVRVEFAGAQLRPNEETNSFTWGGCGRGTIGEYLQAHYGFDDSFEWFGGTNDAKYLVGTYGADDFLDVQIGYTGRVQHVIAVANADNSNRCIEADNYERDFTARPLGRWTVYNLTCVGNGGTRGFDETDASAVYVRRGAGGFYNNILVFNWMTRGIGGADFASVLANGPENLGMDGVLRWNNGGLDNAVNTQTVAGLQQFVSQRARNVMTMDPRLRRPLEYSDPDFRGGPGSPVFRANWTTPPEDGFFDQWASWIGGIGDYDWTEEWTTFHQEEDLRP